MSRKNELGLILDLISSCLDMDPKRRPTISGLINSPLFSMDHHEEIQSRRFSQNVILYRSPESTVTMKLTGPLRNMCALAIKYPERLVNIQDDILRMFQGAQDCVAHLSSFPLEELNEILTDEERRRALEDPVRAKFFKGKDSDQLRVSPNSPLAAQIVEDKVIDMLIFMTFRFTKAFEKWKARGMQENDDVSLSPSPLKEASQTQGSRSVRPSEVGTEIGSIGGTSKLQAKRAQNYVITRMTKLLGSVVHELHSYSTPMAPFVKEIVDYVVKFFAGEEYELGSDSVLRRTSTTEFSLKDFLRDRSFFRKDQHLAEDFKSDPADKAWNLE